MSVTSMAAADGRLIAVFSYYRASLLIAGMTTSTQGYAIADALSPAGQIWLTRNGGRTWTPVTIR